MNLNGPSDFNFRDTIKLDLDTRKTVKLDIDNRKTVPLRQADLAADHQKAIIGDVGKEMIDHSLELTFTAEELNAALEGLKEFEPPENKDAELDLGDRKTQVLENGKFQDRESKEDVSSENSPISHDPFIGLQEALAADSEISSSSDSERLSQLVESEKRLAHMTQRPPVPMIRPTTLQQPGPLVQEPSVKFPLLKRIASFAKTNKTLSPLKKAEVEFKAAGKELNDLESLLKKANKTGLYMGIKNDKVVLTKEKPPDEKAIHAKVLGILTNAIHSGRDNAEVEATLNSLSAAFSPEQANHIKGEFYLKTAAPETLSRAFHFLSEHLLSPENFALLETEGLGRLSPSANDLGDLLAKLISKQSQFREDEFSTFDAHTKIGAVKKIGGNMKLFGTGAQPNQQFLELTQLSELKKVSDPRDKEEISQAIVERIIGKLTNVVNALPEQERKDLYSMVSLMAELSRHEAATKMGISNWALMLGPMLSGSVPENQLMQATGPINKIAEILIRHSDSIF